MTTKQHRVASTTLWLVLIGSLIGTALLTVPRWLDPVSNRGIQLVGLTPLGLPTAVVALLAGTLLVVISGRRSKLWAWLGTAIGLGGVLVHAIWLAPLFTGQQPDATGDPLVVMTQNFELGSVDSLVTAVAEHEVDVLVLTDLNPAQVAALDASRLATLLPHASPAGGGGVQVLSRHPLVDQPPLELEGRSQVLSVQTPQLGAITLIAAHIAQPHNSASDWAADLAEVETRVSSILEQQPMAPVVLAGDLNATLDHAPVRDLLDTGLTDSVEAVRGGWRPTYPAPGSTRRFGLGIPPLVQIDHVMVSRALVVTNSANVTVSGADHLGVVATIRRAAA